MLRKNVFTHGFISDIKYLNRVKHLEDNDNNGFRMKDILALNRHWYDVLLDYSPTKLSIDMEHTHEGESTIYKFIQKLKCTPLKNMKHLKILADFEDTEGFEN